MEVKVSDRDAQQLEVVVVAFNASTVFGGEAILPIHYFREHIKAGFPTWLVVHARTREEIETLFPEALDRVFFIADSGLHRVLNRCAKLLPAKIGQAIFGTLTNLDTQRSQKKIVRDLIRQHNVGLVHEPVPVSPKLPSLMHGLGVPVIIGPMNGGMDYPPAFARRRGAFERGLIRLVRWSANAVHQILPGKLRAELLLVANERSRRALPDGRLGEVRVFVENGVDFSIWQQPERDESASRDRARVRFIFVGRLMSLKAVDLLLRAFAKLLEQASAELIIIGDGPELERLEQQVAAQNIEDNVSFLGWMPQTECARHVAEADVFVLPSLHECGGAVVLEAMALGMPVIATNWGGPADYVDDTCGILVEPTSAEGFVEGLYDAMLSLCQEPQLRTAMGVAGLRKAREEFDWVEKARQMRLIYQEVMSAQPTSAETLKNGETTP